MKVCEQDSRSKANENRRKGNEPGRKGIEYQEEG